jgi:hypothetical protein
LALEKGNYSGLDELLKLVVCTNGDVLESTREYAELVLV